MKIGFIGQGWIGKNYADDFENRGYTVIRYAKEAPYDKNEAAIKTCDIVFIAVPTPTTPKGFDASIVKDVLKFVGKGKTAVIKSTLLPGTTEMLQKENSQIIVLNSPEFLSTNTASHDASNPKRNIIGIPIDNVLYRSKAQEVMKILAKAPYEKICGSKDAEIIKYARNVIGYVRVIFANIIYDLAKESGADWVAIREAISADPDNGPTYMNPIHKSGRGAGGECFIKDFAAFSALYKEMTDDSLGQEVLAAVEKKNKELLKSTNKDMGLLRGVYGDRI